MYSRGEAILLVLCSLVAGTGLGMFVTSLISQKEVDKAFIKGQELGLVAGEIKASAEILHGLKNRRKANTDSTDKGEETES